MAMLLLVIYRSLQRGSFDAGGDSYTLEPVLEADSGAFEGITPEEDRMMIDVEGHTYSVTRVDTNTTRNMTEDQG